MNELKKYTVVMAERNEQDSYMLAHCVNAFDSQEAIKLAEHLHFNDRPRQEYQACVFDGHCSLVDEV